MSKLQHEDTHFPYDIHLTEQVLFNSLIFENLLRFVPISDLKSVRLVCTLWEERSRAKWRKHAVLQIRGVIHATSPLINQPPNAIPWKCVTMKQVLEHMFRVNTNIPNDPWNLIKHPIQNVRICTHVLIGSTDEMETTFWKLFGPHIKQLYLEQVSVPTNRQAQFQLQRILGELTPNLERYIYSQCVVTTRLDEVPLPGEGMTPSAWMCDRLTLITISVDEMNSNGAKYHCDIQRNFTDSNSAPDFEEYLRNTISPFSTARPPEFIIYPFCWNLHLGNYPQIKHISSSVDTTHRTHEQFVKHQIREIKAIRDNDKSALNIESWLGILYEGDLMTQFCALGLPLKKFSGLISGSEQGSGIHEFLTAHQNTLKSLNVQGFALETAPPLWLPKGLTYLEMMVGLGGCKLDFLTHTPNLETFILTKSPNNNGGSMPAFGQLYISPLKHLTKFSCALNVNDATFSKCVDLMPNLKKVKIAMDGKRWMIACLGWTKLECCEVVDTIRPWPGGHQLVLNEEALVKFAVDFTNLKTLVIETKVRFGDMSIYDGFLKMPALKNLTVKFLPEVSPAAILLLKKEIPFVNC